MLGPDQRLFDADLLSAEFRCGVVKDRWGEAGADVIPEGAAWPRKFFWLAAAPRENAPERFYVALDAAGYRLNSPTGTFWDPANKTLLDFGKFPKGKPNSRFSMVFRTNWGESRRAFYHPYDRVAAQSHGQWPREQPHLVWTNDHTIVDYLEEFQSLLNCGDYLGV